MGATRGIKPHRWKVGPDPRRHEQYKAWAQQRNQAQWRGEDWQLEFDDWALIWDPHWDTRRGRRSDCLCLVRVDYDLPWTPDNVELKTRLEHTQTQSKKLEQQRGKHWRLKRNHSRLFAQLEDVRD